MGRVRSIKQTTRWNHGEFIPDNPEKYIGTYPIIFRSSWELTAMHKFDEHPSILYWAYEFERIPYTHPITGKIRFYIPDFLVIYNDKKGKRHAEVLEIKPKKEQLMENAKTARDRIAVALNMAKWGAAQKWCKKNGLGWRVIGEDGLYKR